MLTTRSWFRLLPEDGTVCCTMPSLQDMGAQHCLHHPPHQGCSKSCHSPTLHLEQPPHGEGTEAARTLWDTLLHSLVPSSPLQHPPPIANCSNFQELSQSKGHMFFPALSSPSWLTDDQMRHTRSILAPGIPAGTLC